MKPSVIRISSFLVILVLSIIVCDQSYKFLLKRVLYIQKKDNHFKVLDEYPRFLFLGDSHVLNSLNPNIFKESYNYASPNENYIQTYYRLKYILETFEEKPEKIILPIDPSSFSRFRSDRFRFNAYWIDFIDFFELAQEKKDISYIESWFAAKFVSFGGQYSGYRTLFYNNEKDLKTDLLGYKPRHAVFTEKEGYKELGEKRVKLYFKTFDDKIPEEDYFDKDLKNYFLKCLDLCLANEIEIVLVRMPQSEEYLNAIKTIFKIENLYDKIDSLISDYPNYLVLDSFQNKYSSDLFRNPDHMNHEGATEFTMDIFEVLTEKKLNRDSIRDEMTSPW